MEIMASLLWASVVCRNSSTSGQRSLGDRRELFLLREGPLRQWLYPGQRTGTALPPARWQCGGDQLLAIDRYARDFLAPVRPIATAFRDHAGGKRLVGPF